MSTRPGNAAPCPLGEFCHPLLLGFGPTLQVALNSIADQTPLRPRAHGAQGLQRGPHLGWQANTQLRIVLDSLALASSGRRSPDSPTRFREFPRHRLPMAVFVLAKTCR